MSQWFLLHNEKVTGPFSGDEIKAQYASGQVPQECLVWGRAQNAWQPMAHWTKQVPEPTVTAVELNSQQLWHFAIDGDSKGPLSRVELINELKNVHHKGEVLVWTKGMKAWADLFEFHDLLDELGLNRREHPRANITGSVIVKYENQALIGQLKTISPGGFGVTNLNQQLSIGQVVSVEIKSEHLNSALILNAIVQYHADSGFYGFKFQAINMEAQAHILEYIHSAKAKMDTAA